MKLPRILLLGALTASVLGAAATPAAAQTVYFHGPQTIGYQYTYYEDYAHTQLVSINYMGCNGVETWDGYNGNDDLTLGQFYDYVQWDC
jgi:hypothetical protein